MLQRNFEQLYSLHNLISINECMVWYIISMTAIYSYYLHSLSSNSGGLAKPVLSTQKHAKKYVCVNSQNRPGQSYGSSSKDIHRKPLSLLV